MGTTISPERLAELRALPYEEYIKTPEWLLTRKRILKRDNYTCQGCRAQKVLLHVHHYTYARLGCEDDEDLVTLCEVCRDELHRQLAEVPRLSLVQMAEIGLGVATVGTIGIEGFLQAPLPAEIGVLIAAILFAKNSPAMYARLKANLPEGTMKWLGTPPAQREPGELTWVDRWVWNKHRRPLDLPSEEEREELHQQNERTDDEDEERHDENQDPRFIQPSAKDTGGIERLTIEEIVAHTKPNSFTIWIGRSLTKDGNPAILINFYKQHFRFIGSSQRGKSSMIAAFLEIVTRTHDPKHVQVILLDKENLTSNLFADLPHVLHLRTPSGDRVKLHARSEQQVLEYLTYAVVIMKRRYQIAQRDGIAALKKMPVILIYIEEFLRLKAYFKAQIKTATEKEQAEKDYAVFMHCINELAGLGLKLRMQLLMAAQVEFADDDFREAMANISCGFSFCVKREAAMAAGFTNAELLTRNLKENKVGQAVVECPDCNDLVLAPEYDLEARLEAWQEVNEGLDDEIETEHLPEVSSLPTQQDQEQEAQQQEQIKTLLMKRQQPQPKFSDQEITAAVTAFLKGANTHAKLGAALNKEPWYIRQIMPYVKAEIERQETAINE